MITSQAKFLKQTMKEVTGRNCMTRTTKNRKTGEYGYAFCVERLTDDQRAKLQEKGEGYIFVDHSDSLLYTVVRYPYTRR